MQWDIGAQQVGMGSRGTQREWSCGRCSRRKAVGTSQTSGHLPAVLPTIARLDGQRPATPFGGVSAADITRGIRAWPAEEQAKVIAFSKGSASGRILRRSGIA